MQTAATVGLDIAKNVFQVHGTGVRWQLVIRQHEARSCPAFLQEAGAMCLGIEACASVASLGPRDRGTRPPASS